MNRVKVTRQNLELKVFELNCLVFPNQGKLDQNFRYSIGWYILDMASDGYRLCKIVNSDGGQRDLTPRLTAREISLYITGLINGFHLAQTQMLSGVANV